MVKTILRNLQANDRDDAISFLGERVKFTQSNDQGSNLRYTMGTNPSSSSWSSGCSSSRSDRVDGEGLMAEVESRRRCMRQNVLEDSRPADNAQGLVTPDLRTVSEELEEED
ncbi:hypothetical protein R1flu_010156 [Riccia fluitans]|uniref:Uncharacterized protein n=1 Tax=Riccia fluitans TaxID=41844 RepID=A0ABD1Z476_9MARC